MNSPTRWEPLTWLLLLLLDILTVILVVVLCIGTPKGSSGASATWAPTAVGDADPGAAETPPPQATDDGAAVSELTPTPEPPVDAPRRCLVFGAQAADGGSVDAAKLDANLAAMQALDPDMVFLLGDMVVGSPDVATINRQYQDLNALLEKRFRLFDVFPAIGAREALPEGRASIAAFDAGYPELSPHGFTRDNELYHLHSDYSNSVYFVDTDDVRVFVLNTRFYMRLREVSTSVRHWIRQNIDPHKRFTVFALYDAPFPVGAGVGDAMDANFEERDAFWSLVCEVPGSIVVSGGEAAYARRIMPEGTAGGARAVTQIITGGLGAASMGSVSDDAGIVVGPIARPHFVALYPSENDMEGIAYDMEGHEMDRFVVAP